MGLGAVTNCDARLSKTTRTHHEAALARRQLAANAHLYDSEQRIYGESGKGEPAVRIEVGRSAWSSLPLEIVLTCQRYTAIRCALCSAMLLPFTLTR